MIDARGEPVDFTYNRVAAKHRFLWRERDLKRAVSRELLKSLLDLCPKSPSAVFCLAREVHPELLIEDVDIQAPVARVAEANETIGVAGEEEHERLEAASSVQLFWVRGRPSDATPAHRLVEKLASRGLMLEPFERVVAGLREAYELSFDADADSSS